MEEEEQPVVYFLSSFCKKRNVGSFDEYLRPYLDDR